MVQETDVTLDAAPPDLAALFAAFARIGLTSFGGGLSGWMLRDFVERRRWLSEDEFLNGLAVAQAPPGVNVTNMSIWIGYRLQGLPGAIAGFLGLVLPPMAVILGLGLLFGTMSGLGPVATALTGAAAAAVGMPLYMGISAAIRVRRTVFPLAVMALTFLAATWAHLPLIWIVLGFGGISVLHEWRRRGGGQR